MKGITAKMAKGAKSVIPLCPLCSLWLKVIFFAVALLACGLGEEVPEGFDMPALGGLGADAHS